MFFKRIGMCYIILFERGEKIIASLMALCEAEKIEAGFFNGLGAVGEVELAHFSLPKKEYSFLKLSGQYEITSFHGNISTLDGKPYIHSHITVGDDKFEARSGHLKEAVVSVTAEIVLMTLEGQLTRSKDLATGINLLDL